MYKVLLADDEPWVIYGLKKIIDWNAYGFEVIEEAADGMQALKILRSGIVDAVFSDIRMPGVDGMQLIEILSREENPVKVVLISGYSEFAYAKKAVTCGVFDYLLKQIKKEDMENVLVRLKETLDREHASRKQEEMLAQIAGDVEDQEGFLEYLQEQYKYQSKAEDPVSELVREVLDIIRKYYAEDIQLAGFAEEHNVSLSHLSNLIKKETGYTYTEHITRRRIEAAQQLLQDEQLSVAQVAEQVGYGDYFYFTKIFKKYVGISPSKFRKK